MWNIETYVATFFEQVAQGNIEIYNEFSLQHELGCYLRAAMPAGVRVQFERPASHFGIQDKLTKKEIDIAVFPSDLSYKAAIELKYPKNGQHPEQMFKACQDIAFLEQLCVNGFDSGYFVMAADHPLFYASGGIEGIYKHFRAGHVLSGYIQKPTGAKDEAVMIDGSYVVKWNAIVEMRKYAVVQVNRL